MTYHYGLLVSIECLKGSVPGQWSSANGQANCTAYGILWLSVDPKIMSSLQVKKCIWFKFPSWSISLGIHTPSCHVSGSLIPQESAFSHGSGRAWTLRQPACWPPGGHFFSTFLIFRFHPVTYIKSYFLGGLGPIFVKYANAFSYILSNLSTWK